MSLEQQRARRRRLAAQREDRAQRGRGRGARVRARIARREHVAGHGHGAVPVAVLAQDDGEAGQAQLGGRLEPARRAERERVVVGRPRGGVVAGVLERVGEALVDLGRRCGEVAVERHRERRADQLEPLPALAHARPHVALEAHDPGLEVGTARGAGVGARELEQLERGAEAGGRAEMGGGGEPLGRRLAGRARGSERGGRLLARRQRLLPAALDLERAGEPARRLADAQRVGLAATAVDDVTPLPHRLPRLARELGAARQALERIEAARIVLPVRPQLERPSRRPRAVDVRVHRVGGIGGGEEASPRTVGLACLAPVLGHDRGRHGGRLEPLRHQPVQGPPPQERDVAVEGVSHQRVPERHVAGRPLDQEAEPEQLVRPLVQARDRHHRLDVEALAGDGRHRDRRPRLVRKAGCPQQHGVAHAVRQREVLPGVQLAAPPGRCAGAGSRPARAPAR